MKHLSAILFLVIIGCQPKPIPDKYIVTITSPHGVQKQFTVDSVEKPILKETWGGQTKLYDFGTSEPHQWEKDLIVPAGWMVEVKEKRYGQTEPTK